MRVLLVLLYVSLISFIWMSECVEIPNNAVAYLRAKDIVEGPFHGNVTVLPGRTISYTPDPLYQGDDYFIDKDGITNITVYKPCPSIPLVEEHAQNGLFPRPVLSVVNDNFEVSLPYYREEVSYILDICDPLIRLSNCASNISSTYESSPSAEFPYALGNHRYGAYNNVNSRWSMYSLNCSQIKYVSNISLSQLTRCSAPSPCVSTVHTNGTQVIYSGNVYVVYTQNGNPVSRWKLPFRHIFRVESNILISKSLSPLVKVYSLSIPSTEGLYIRVKTVTYDSSYYCTIASIPQYLQLKSIPANTQSQIWEFNTNESWISRCSTLIDNICWFSFSWYINPSHEKIDVRIGVSLIPINPIAIDHKVNSSLLLYTDPSFNIRRDNDIYQREVIYLTHILDTDDLHILYPHNIWVCHTRNNVLLDYNLDTGDHGCLQEFIVPENNRYHICRDGVFHNSSYWNIYIYSYNKNRIGFGIELLQPQDVKYYIHVESHMKSTSRRASQSLYTDMYSITVQNDISTVWIPIVVSLAVLGIVIIITIIVTLICIIVRKVYMK